MSEWLLAIDPGNVESAFSVVDIHTRRSVNHDKVPNDEMLELVIAYSTVVKVVHIEMIASYGMSVGEEVFETCVWIGRFEQAARQRAISLSREIEVVRTKRLAVKMHLCHTASAKDSNVTQALVDRFASGQPNKGKGTKANPGWFHGFAKDIWQAYALGVYAADHL